jgi:hypothetical protein
MPDTFLLNRIEKITMDGRDIFIIDYSDCKEYQMISLIQTLKEQVLLFNKPVSVLSVFNDKSYATPAFMRELKTAARETSHLLDREAVVGLSDTKKMILKGYNFLFGKDIQAFHTREVAMQHILSGKV